MDNEVLGDSNNVDSALYATGKGGKSGITPGFRNGRGAEADP